MKKILNALILMITLFATTSLFATEEIYLPDLTTEIEGDTKKIKPEIDVPVSKGNFELPKKQAQEEEVVSEEPVVEVVAEEIPEPKVEKLISAEGKIGGGFPGNFVGDFSVFSTKEDNPFKINFSHETAEGYFGTPFSAGYNDKETLVSGEKKFSYKNFVFDFYGIYKSLENGLQSKEADITSFNQREYKGNAGFSWKLQNEFLFYTGFGASSYNRFADALPNENLLPWVNDISIFSMMPELKISWSNEKSGLGAYLGAKYFYDNDIKDVLLEGNYHVANRGEFNLGIFWKNNFIKVFGDVGAVIGNQIGNNDVIVPFTVGVCSQIPISFSDRKFKINTYGGLESDRTDIGLLEEMYKFSLISFMPNETTDWFGVVDVELPIKDSFTASIFGEYRQSAFDNGVFEPIYENDYLVSGGYKYNCLNRRLIKTHEKFSYSYKFFSVDAGWLSFWDFVPAGFDRQSVTIDLNFQHTDLLWGASLKSTFGVVTEDYVPNIGIEAFVHITPQVRIAVEVGDTLKLINMAPRTYAGQYAARSGSASLFIKVFF